MTRFAFMWARFGNAGETVYGCASRLIGLRRRPRLSGNRFKATSWRLVECQPSPLAAVRKRLRLQYPDESVPLLSENRSRVVPNSGRAAKVIAPVVSSGA